MAAACVGHRRLGSRASARLGTEAAFGFRPNRALSSGRALAEQRGRLWATKLGCGRRPRRLAGHRGFALGGLCGFGSAACRPAFAGGPGRPGIDHDRFAELGVLQQRGRLWRCGRRLEQERSHRPNRTVALGAAASTLSSSSAAGRLRCGPHISSCRLAGRASTGASDSTVPSEGVSQDSGLPIESTLEQLRRLDGAHRRGRRAQHDGDQLPAVAGRGGDEVEAGGADEAGLHAVGARIAAEQRVVVAHRRACRTGSPGRCQ